MPAPPAKSSCSGFWGCLATAVQVVAPIITVVAIATAFIPGVDAVTGALAVGVQAVSYAADAIGAVSTVMSGVNTYDDVKNGASGWKTALDGLSTVAGLVGIGAMGASSLGTSVEAATEAVGTAGEAANEAKQTLGAAQAINMTGKGGNAYVRAHNAIPALYNAASSAQGVLETAQHTLSVSTALDAFNIGSNYASAAASAADDLYGTPDLAPLLYSSSTLVP
jgi:hypothetical protein